MDELTIYQKIDRSTPRAESSSVLYCDANLMEDTAISNKHRNGLWRISLNPAGIFLAPQRLCVYSARRRGSPTSPPPSTPTQAGGSSSHRAGGNGVPPYVPMSDDLLACRAVT